MSAKILLLEDDKLFNETLQDFLEEEGYSLKYALDPYTALDFAYEEKFDLYLFDVNLPYESGFDLLKKLRESGDMTPTIFITSRDDIESLKSGFDAGADDYLTKPIDLDELLLRIEAVLRRLFRTQYITLGAYNIDSKHKQVFRDGEIVELPKKVIDLLLLFIVSKGQIVNIEEIKLHLWPASQDASEGSIRVYIAQLKKLFPNTIENIRGIGYRFTL